MTGFAYFLHLAFTNVRRGGQRVLVALLCIMFGVMSLVAMTLLSQSIESSLVLQPSELIGADISLNRPSGESILPEHLAGLQLLQQSGQIQRYTSIAMASSLMFHTPGSGEMHFVPSGMGVDPAQYPLVGSLIIGEPGNVGLATLLQEAGDVIVSRDIVQENKLKVGDTIVLSDLAFGAPVQARIRGIAYDTPNHQGSRIYYNQATAQQLTGGQLMVDVALVTTQDPAKANEQLKAAGWETYVAVDLAARGSQSDNLILIGLRGCGILGLLVGGIGIANTMQVLLRRRQREVAIWKTLGYREGQLQAMFALEAALLGILGSLLGAGAGVFVSFRLVDLFRRTSNLLFAWSFAPVPVLLGIGVGILTTVIFALWAIVLASRAQPMALLRNEPVDLQQVPWWKSLLLAGVLALPFTAITSLAMGSLLAGGEVLLFALAGLVVLGGLFSGLLWVVTRLLPLRGLPLGRMAQQSLRRRGLPLVFAMIALFTGVVSMTLGVIVTQNGRKEMDERSIQIKGYNLNVLAPASQAQAVRAAVQNQNPEKVAYGYRTSVKGIRVAGSDQKNDLEPVLVGRSDPGDYAITGAGWGSNPQGVYVYQYAGIPVGSDVEVTFQDGSKRTFDVVGSYSYDFSSGSLYPQLGLLVPSDLFSEIATPEMMTVFVQAPAGQVNNMAAALGAALPQATVINLLAYSTRFIQTYQNLFVLAMAMAGLALLAGILLVANAVSLAMLDRRYEIGVLKTVGYSRLHILVTLAVEYSSVSLISCAVGLLAVRIFLWVVALSNPLAGSLLVLTPLAAILIVLCGVGLPLLTILGVTWGPTRVSPLLVLNDRG